MSGSRREAEGTPRFKTSFENRSRSVVAPLWKRNHIRRTSSEPFQNRLRSAAAAMTNVE
jgi:hypothetical protein